MLYLEDNEAISSIDGKGKRVQSYPFTRALVAASELPFSEADSTGGSDSSMPLTFGATESVAISEAMIDCDNEKCKTGVADT